MSKRPTPLIEVLGREGKGSGKVELPAWLSGQKDQDSGKVVYQGQSLPEKGKAQDQGPKLEPDDAAGLQLSTGPWVITVGLRHVAVAAAVLVFAVFGGYMWGRTAEKAGSPSGVAGQSTAELARIKSSAARPEVLDLKQVIPLDSQSGQGQVSGGGQERIARSGDAGGIARETGLNYLIIQSFSKLEAASRAATYMNTKAIACSVVKSGRLYLLVSQEGFDFADGQERKKSEQFENQIHVLGQMYKKDNPQVGVDFATCYYKKW